MRTLLIGLDGATFTILDDLVKEGPDGPVMPFLSKIYKEGVRCKLLSTPNPLTPPAWVSLMTGESPGYHGIYDFIRAEEADGDMFFTLYDSRDNRSETIWSIASRQGKRVAALNFPFTAPPPSNLNGFMVPGFVPWRHLRRNSRPDDLYDRMKALPGFDPKELAWDFDREKKAIDLLSDEERENWIRYHLPREAQWFRIADNLLGGESLDLMAVMFDGVDKLQHQAWQFIDPGLRDGVDGEYCRRMRELCMDYFRQLDGFIEKLITAAGPDVQTFIASDHGFTSTYEIVRINVYLHEKGYLKWKPVSNTPEAVRRENSMFSNLEWKDTVAYCQTPSSNGITIRVARKPGDTGIRPEDYQTFRDSLIKDLENLRDLETGERIISRIYKREEVFSGPAMGNAPDLLLSLRDSGFVSIKNISPVIERRSEVAGTHHPEGIFLAYGPGINRGAVKGEMKIVDVAAVLLYSLGLEVPGDMEGRVAGGIFTEDYLAGRPVRISNLGSVVEKDERSEEMAEDEKNKIMSQLRMLGYME